MSKLAFFVILILIQHTEILIISLITNGSSDLRSLAFKEFFGLGSIGVWDHGGTSLLPVNWTDFSIFVCVLEGFNKSEDVWDISTNW